MTFNEYGLGLNLDLDQTDDRFILEISRNAWNAAIASSLNAVDAVNKRNIDENDVFVYLYEDLRKLLTA